MVSVSCYFIDLCLFLDSELLFLCFRKVLETGELFYLFYFVLKF